MGMDGLFKSISSISLSMNSASLIDACDGDLIDNCDFTDIGEPNAGDRFVTGVLETVNGLLGLL